MRAVPFLTRLAKELPLLLSVKGVEERAARMMLAERRQPDSYSFHACTGFPLGLQVIDFVASRAHSMKRSTTGLKVRFRSVVTITGHGRSSRSTGRTLNPLRCTANRGYAVRCGPFARK